MKKHNKILISLLAVILIAGVLFMYYPTSQTQYYNDKDLGVIKIVVQETNWLTNLLHPTQQTYFGTAPNSPVYKTVGQSATVTVVIPVSHVYGQITQWEVQISKDNFASATIINMGSQANALSLKADATYLVTTSFSTSTAGTYNVRDKACYANTGCQFISGYNSLIVSTDSTPSCTKTAYYGEYFQSGTFSNGIYQEKSLYYVDNNCNYYIGQQYTNERTVCNTGYVITGTSNTIGSGHLTCEQVYVAPPVPVCECNVDLTTTCSDGSNIVIKTCVQQCTYLATGNTCLTPSNNTQYCPTGYTGTYPNCIAPIVNNSVECTTPLKYTCTDNTIINVKDCVNGKYITTNNQCSNGDNGQVKSDNTLVYFIIGTCAFIALGIIAILVIRRRRK